jgi:hypothetical protein
MTMSRWMLMTGIALAMPIGAGLFSVWVNQDAVRLGYQLSVEEKERARLQEMVRQLEIERAAERSPEHLLQWAAKLGLMPPASTQVLREQPSRSREKASGHGQQ